MRILGLDFGSKTVGVAVSDALLITAQGVEIIRRKAPTKLRQTLARIEQLVSEYEVENCARLPEKYEQYRRSAARKQKNSRKCLKNAVVSLLFYGMNG